MKRFALLAFAALSLQACAPGGTTAPSYLGLSAAAGISGDAEDMPDNTEEHPDLQHVASNKVLGAMAFQKVTGRAVDPSRLQSGQ